MATRRTGCRCFCTGKTRSVRGRPVRAGPRRVQPASGLADRPGRRHAAARLSAGLFLLFALTFLLTCRAVERLARAVWPELGAERSAGSRWACSWRPRPATSARITSSRRWSWIAHGARPGLAGHRRGGEQSRRPDGGARRPRSRWRRSIHPSVGFSSRWSWGRAGWSGRCSADAMDVSVATAAPGVGVLGARRHAGTGDQSPARIVAPGRAARRRFWLLSVELQSPQHMLPHLWRMPQWLAWFCYLALAALHCRIGQSLADGRVPCRSDTVGRSRLAARSAPIGRHAGRRSWSGSGSPGTRSRCCIRSG